MAGAKAPFGDRRRRAGGRAGRVLLHARGDRRVDLGDRVDRLEDRAADRRAPTGRQRRDDVEQHLLVVGRRLDDLREAGERDDADLHAAVLVLDERRGGLLGGDEPVRRDVGRAHAARHVHREDDGRPTARDRDDGRRPGDREDQARRARAGTARTAGAGGSATSAGRRADERQAREPDAGPSASQRPDPNDDEHRQGDEEHQQAPGQAPHGSWHPPEPAQRRQAADEEQREPEPRRTTA